MTTSGRRSRRRWDGARVVEGWAGRVRATKQRGRQPRRMRRRLSGISRRQQIVVWTGFPQTAVRHFEAAANRGLDRIPQPRIKSRGADDVIPARREQASATTRSHRRADTLRHFAIMLDDGAEVAPEAVLVELFAG